MTRARSLSIAMAVFVLLAGFGLTAALAQGGDAPPTAAEEIAVSTPESEPNDSFWEANYSSLGYLYHGAISPAGDVDYYEFYANRGMPLVVTIDMPTTSPLTPLLTLYDGNQQPVAQATCSGPGVCLTYTAANWDYYFLTVEDATSAGGRKYQYKFELDIVDVFEPNDFMDQAAPIAYGDSVWASFDPAGDVDFFTFEGVSGDNVSLPGLDGYIFDADGNEVAAQWTDNGRIYVLPATGTYYLQLSADYCSPCYYNLSLVLLDVPVYLSLSGNGAVGGVPFTSGDILLYWMGSEAWEMYFDASDMELKGNLVALNFGNYGLQLVYNKSQNVPGLGPVGPNDILSFQGYSFGEDTAGYLDWYFDGSDVGLTKASEGIDALGSHPYGGLVMSTTGTASVPYGAGGLRLSKSDLVAFYDSYLGANTAGIWQPFRDGFSLNVGAANLWGVDLEDSQLYVSFDRRVVLDGVVLDAGDIALCRLEWYTSGCASVQKYFDASEAGLGGYKVDAFDVGTPAQGYPYP